MSFSFALCNVVLFTFSSLHLCRRYFVCNTVRLKLLEKLSFTCKHKFMQHYIIGKIHIPHIRLICQLIMRVPMDPSIRCFAHIFDFYANKRSGFLNIRSFYFVAYILQGNVFVARIR